MFIRGHFKSRRSIPCQFSFSIMNHLANNKLILSFNCTIFVCHAFVYSDPCFNIHFNERLVEAYNLKALNLQYFVFAAGPERTAGKMKLNL